MCVCKRLWKWNGARVSVVVVDYLWLVLSRNPSVASRIAVCHGRNVAASQPLPPTGCAKLYSTESKCDSLDRQGEKKPETTTKINSTFYMPPTLLLCFFCVLVQTPHSVLVLPYRSGETYSECVCLPKVSSSKHATCPYWIRNTNFRRSASR